jgi:hypothetical protein
VYNSSFSKVGHSFETVSSLVEAGFVKILFIFKVW